MLIHAAEIPEIIYLFFKSEKLSFVEYECHLRFPESGTRVIC